MERARRGKPNHRETGCRRRDDEFGTGTARARDEYGTGGGTVDTAGSAYSQDRTLRRWWLTRRLHIDLLRVCSAFGR
ncbi:hypothetical protein [Streptomyces sp. NPDC059533]|uniref:hypothetical protein n=1 Tax=unclassified Streptomyces TaxID=2593676 RepID=UPI00369B755B